MCTDYFVNRTQACFPWRSASLIPEPDSVANTKLAVLLTSLPGAILTSASAQTKSVKPPLSMSTRYPTIDQLND